MQGAQDAGRALEEIGERLHEADDAARADHGRLLVSYMAMEYHLFDLQSSHDRISRLVDSAGLAITFQKADPNGGVIHAHAKEVRPV
jgi:hypothetical protein